MKRFIIADPHFGHENIIKYENRPFSNVKEMDEKLIALWNKTIGKDDLIYILGDFTLSRNKETISKLVSTLHGRKVLIMGNHDTKKPKDYMECGFEEVTRKPIMVEPGVILMHEPFNDENFISSLYIYFFGHVHANKTMMDECVNAMCVCAERTEYKPIDLDKAIKKMKRAMEEENNYIAEKIKEGLEDIEAGRVLSLEEVSKKLEEEFGIKD